MGATDYIIESGARCPAAKASERAIGAQLLLGYWFYSYLTWFYPLLIVAIIRARPGQAAVLMRGARASMMMS